MKKRSVLSFPVLAVCCLTIGWALPAMAEQPVAAVHIVGPEEDLEAKRSAMGLPYLIDTDREAPGQIFLVIPTMAGQRFETFALEMGADEQLHLGNTLQRFDISGAGAGIVVRHPVSEGIPSFAVCLMGDDRTRQCWVPRYNGTDGSLVLDRGFYPAWEELAANETGKISSMADESLLTGNELMDQPYIMVKPLESENQLAKLADAYRFVPVGTFKPEMPHHVMLMPLVVPAKARLYVMEHKGGDGFLRPAPEEEISLDEFGAAVFSLDLFGLNSPDDPDDEKSYVFAFQVDGEKEEYHWYPRLNRETGQWGGTGFGTSGKFIAWPYGD